MENVLLTSPPAPGSVLTFREASYLRLNSLRPYLEVATDGDNPDITHINYFTNPGTTRKLKGHAPMLLLAVVPVMYVDEDVGKDKIERWDMLLLSAQGTGWLLSMTLELLSVLIISRQD